MSLRGQRTSSNPKGWTQSQYSFSQIPSVQTPRSQLRRSHGLKTTFDSGYLVPILVDEALPGDTFNCRMTGVLRLTTQLVPIMDNLFVDTFFFAIPYRLVWDNWEKFNGAQDDPGDSIAFTCPEMTQTPTANSLSDYLGIPIGNSLTFNSFWHRCYNLVWNTWFRSEDLQDSAVVDTDDGPDTAGDYVLLRRGKRHDYFTSCLPFVQKGDAVELPLGTSAPVTQAVVTASGAPTFDVDDTTGNTFGSVGGPGTGMRWANSVTNADTTAVWNDAKLSINAQTADLTSATASTINEIRLAFQTQKLLERDARGGTRYTEIVRSHFGVISADQRLQRPEYLGGGSTRVNITPVAQTNVGVSGKVGDLAAFGLGVSSGDGFVKSFTEHCLILGLINVRADITYQQGLNRMFSRQSRYDFYWPSFAFLGEQAVLNKEIYADGSGNDDLTFGYNERWSEYRYKPSQVTGTMRSDAASSLEAWHLALDFASLPTLNSTFIEDDPPVDRIVQVPAEPHWRADLWFDYTAARPMPTFSVPGLVDHF